MKCDPTSFVNRFTLTAAVEKSSCHMQTVIQQQQLHLYYMQSAMQGEKEMRQEVRFRLQKKTAGKAVAGKERNVCQDTAAP